MSEDNKYGYHMTVDWPTFRTMNLDARLNAPVKYVSVNISADEWQALVDESSGPKLKLALDDTK